MLWVVCEIPWVVLHAQGLLLARRLPSGNPSAANTCAENILLLLWYKSHCICHCGQPDWQSRLPEGKQQGPKARELQAPCSLLQTSLAGL